MTDTDLITMQAHLVRQICRVSAEAVQWMEDTPMPGMEQITCAEHFRLLYDDQKGTTVDEMEATYPHLREVAIKLDWLETDVTFVRCYCQSVISRLTGGFDPVCDRYED